MIQPPIPIADLRPEHLVGKTTVHAFDPAHDGSGITLSIPGRGWLAPAPGQTVDVLIDNAHAATELVTIRAIIATAVGS